MELHTIISWCNFNIIIIHFKISPHWLFLLCGVSTGAEFKVNYYFNNVICVLIVCNSTYLSVLMCLQQYFNCSNLNIWLNSYLLLLGLREWLHEDLYFPACFAPDWIMSKCKNKVLFYWYKNLWHLFMLCISLF